MKVTLLVKERQAIRPLLRLDDPADALTAYYALSHDEKRVQLTVGHDGFGKANGFVAVCQTGIDLFRPLVVARAWFASVAKGLLERALIAGRPYYVIASPTFSDVLNDMLNIQERATHIIYEARRASFKPVINVLVVGSRNASAEDKPRFVIRSAAGDVVAEAGLNWQSDEFAEVYAQVQSAAQGRGLGRSVVSACTAYLLEAGLRPLYIADQNNLTAIRLCQALGYADTGAREAVCAGIRKHKGA